MRQARFGLVLGALLLPQLSFALSPPQYTIQRQIAASFGASPCVHVGEIYQGHSEKTYFINVRACSDSVAGALGVVLKRDWDLGGIRLIVKVLGPPGEIDPEPNPPGDPVQDVAARFEAALQGNPYFIATHSTPGAILGPDIWVEVAPQVIQYWNDNLIDYYSNSNEIAADVFTSVSRSKFRGGEVTVWWTNGQVPPAASRLVTDQLP